MSNNLKLYKELFKSVKNEILNSRNKAINAVNKELILLYFNQLLEEDTDYVLYYTVYYWQKR